MNFLGEIEEDLFQDFGNASIFPIQPKPRACSPHFQQNLSPTDQSVLIENLKSISAVMSNEWLKEAKASPEVVRLVSPSIPVGYFYAHRMNSASA